MTDEKEEERYVWENPLSKVLLDQRTDQNALTMSERVELRASSWSFLRYIVLLFAQAETADYPSFVLC